MGAVYTAYHPELDRRVALKLLRPEVEGTDSEVHAQARLLREAQAMAKLSHPNVVPVFDAGTYQNKVYLVMGRVEGATLKQWLGEKHRSWREVLGAFRQAGEGLAAAHAAGLVHRDFKPANVLVGTDGRVQVTDFGLARATGAGPDAEESRALGRDLGEVRIRMLDTPMTEAGVMLGTLAYMAPEQISGQAADERSDQFSFCVALFEGLYGRRPFPGHSAAVLLEAIRQGSAIAPPPEAGVPAWVHRAVMRGLAAAPADRHPSVKALLDVLSRDPGRTRRKWMLSGTAGLALAAAGAVGAVALHGEANRCQKDAGRLAGVWDAQVQDKAKAAFLATGKSYAGMAWSKAKEQMDVYANNWVAANRETCLADVHAGEASVRRQVAVRGACLERRFDEFSTLSSLLATADAALVDEAGSAVQKLSSLASCQRKDADGLLPSGEEEVMLIREARRRLARGRAFLAAARIVEARATIEPILADAVRSGSRIIEAEAAEALGSVDWAFGEDEKAGRNFARALRAAEAVGDDRTLARAVASLISLEGWRLAQPERARLLVPLAEGLQTRLDGEDELVGALLEAQGDLEWQEQDRTASVGHYRQALERFVRASGSDSLDAARLHASIGWVLQELEDFDQARTELQTSLELRERLRGPDHPGNSASWDALGNLALFLGQWESAIASFRRSLPLAEATVGPEGMAVVGELTNLSVALGAAHQTDEALALSRRALGLLEQKPDAAPYIKAAVLHARAGIFLRVRRADAAVDEERQGIKLAEGMTVTADRQRAERLEDMALALVELGRPVEALEYARRSLQVREALHQAHGLDYGMTLVAIGRARAALPHPVEAIAPLEEALRLLQKSEDHQTKADASLALAGAVWAQGDHPRARGLAQQALELATKAGDGVGAARAEKWLANHL